MEQYIPKAAVLAEIKRRIERCAKQREDMLNVQCHTLADDASARMGELNCFQDFLDTLEVIDPYEQCIQYASIESGIKAHAEEYSFNIESELFNQLTKEQQTLWRKEIEQACISGGYSGLNLAKDPRYKENLEVKEVDLDKIINDYFKDWKFDDELDIMVKPNNYSVSFNDLKEIAKHFFELGIKARKGE